MLKYQILDRLKIPVSFLMKYWLLAFFIAAIDYFELVYRLWNFRNISPDFIFPVLFSVSGGTVLFLICSIFKESVNKILVFLFTMLLVLVYGIQLIYFSIFRTPFSFYSITGAGDALQFGDIIISAILRNSAAVILLFVPVVFLIAYGRKIPFSRIRPVTAGTTLLFCIASFIMGIICVNLTDKSTLSQYTLYYKTFLPELSVNRLGLLTTVRLDIKRLVLDLVRGDEALEVSGAETDNNIDTKDKENDEVDNSSGSINGIGDNTGVSDKSVTGAVYDVPEPGLTETDSEPGYNIMNIDFEALSAKEKDQNILGMHKYFSSLQPTKKNKYTGMFRGDNLVLITAESFSPYALSPELTPTLYEMSKSGFVFNNFYNPIWGVSTSDGEYVACTGLIPKSGIWSLARSGKNYMPFTMGNQFKKLGYITKAYHNHTYTYYKRNISHPNMGYDYKGVGNGLNVKVTWPESDLEMIEVTSGEYIGSQPFHVYYMTVSGHMNYNFYGNYIAKKNKKFVDDLPYSDASKAYIASNMELEFAVRELIDRLEAAGIADKTVIAISADHYPYGLPKESIDELAGHELEENFELYKSTFILWKKGIDPVVIDKPSSSLDIVPTLSNLFGLEYDSRLLMGSDILSDTPALVVFSNRSWITDRARYNSITNTATYTDGTENDVGYIDLINRIVADKFRYSEKILETDYYNKVISKDSEKADKAPEEP